MGDDLENGSIERVTQSKNRALRIFNSIFSPQDEMILVAFDQNADEAIDFWGSTDGYLFSQIDSALIEDRWEYKHEEEEQTEVWNEELDKDVEITYHWKFTHTYMKLPLNAINVENTIIAIANMEMGFEPKIDILPYFINLKKNIGFYMYDDRGCIIFSNNKNLLKKYYEEFNSWLVDYHRPYFDSEFMDA